MEDILQPPVQSSSADLPQVSTKDTKADILAAYQELVKRYEDGASKAKGKEQEARKSKEDAVLKQASGYTVEKIVQGCGNLEAAARAWLRDLSESLIRESKKLQDVQEAIRLEEKHLKEVHDITVSAEALAELIETYRTKEREFEEETRRKKEEQARDEDAQIYVLAQRRKREEDAYQEKRAELEKELAERKQAIAAEEQEIKQLRKRAETFDEEISAATAKTAKEGEERARREEKVKADLLAQSVLREKEIAGLKITGLTERLAQLTTETTALKAQLASASKENKEIALKVIEGATTMQNLRRVHAMDRTEAA